MLNKIIVMGRLTRDPELRRTGSGVAVASFRVAVDRDHGPKGEEKKTDFIDCVAWRSIGEFVAKYFQKGSMIIVEGRLEMRDWKDKEGIKRTSAEINAERAYFGEQKKTEGVAVVLQEHAESSAYPETEATLRRFGVAIPDDVAEQLPF
jgi:single-strand DNA-binding protein